MSAPRCMSRDDGAWCTKRLGHSGDHEEDGYIWACREEERFIARLHREVAALKRRIRLARKALQREDEWLYATFDELDPLLDLRKPLPKARR